MSIDEAMAVAREKDIPIVRQGIISTTRRFDPNVSTKYIDTAHEFYYGDELIGERAKINLTFTPETKFLSAVRIRWDNVAENSRFRDEISGMLKSKYGNYSKREKQLFLEKLTWAIDKTSFVSMKIGVDAILLEYVNTRVQEQGQRE
jgi:hypothetical protein